MSANGELAYARTPQTLPILFGYCALSSTIHGSYRPVVQFHRNIVEVQQRTKKAILQVEQRGERVAAEELST